ncbi:MAG: hypothetical protein ACE5GV_13180 [Candidatus Scalindua sp.]
MKKLTKKCTKCGKTKKIAEYQKKKQSKDGLNSICRKCCSQYFKKYYEANKDKIRAKEKEYYEQNKEVIKIHSKEWQINNPEKARLQKKKYREAHRDEVNDHRRSRGLEETP